MANANILLGNRSLTLFSINLQYAIYNTRKSEFTTLTPASIKMKSSTQKAEDETDTDTSVDADADIDDGDTTCKIYSFNNKQ